MATVGQEIEREVKKYKDASPEVRKAWEAVAILEHFKWEQIREGMRKIDDEEDR